MADLWREAYASAAACERQMDALGMLGLSSRGLYRDGWRAGYAQALTDAAAAALRLSRAGILPTVGAVADELGDPPAARADAVKGPMADWLQVRETLALLNSMVMAGEDHSDHSRAMVRQALRTIDAATNPPSDDDLPIDHPDADGVGYR